MTVTSTLNLSPNLKYGVFLIFSLSILGCKQHHQEKSATEITKNIVETYYSKIVRDSFSIFVNLPTDYDARAARAYPVVFLLDANLYFEIVATALNKYSEVGLAPSVILVGIGYKDFPTMDSLRNRDDTYPAAIPEYEMTVSGGADKFLSFITNELITDIDKKYKTDTSRRVIMGHSLGGYFVAYALLQNLRRASSGLMGFIAASPSLHYNHYYLPNQFKELAFQTDRKEKLEVYFTYGGLESDGSEGDSSVRNPKELLAELSKVLSEKQGDSIHYQSDIYSNFSHMDTQIPTFIKGLRKLLSPDN